MDEFERLQQEARAQIESHIRRVVPELTDQQIEMFAQKRLQEIVGSGPHHAGRRAETIAAFGLVGVLDGTARRLVDCLCAA